VKISIPIMPYKYYHPWWDPVTNLLPKSDFSKKWIQRTIEWAIWLKIIC